MIRPEIAVPSCLSNLSGERLGVIILLVNVPLTALYPVLGKAGSSMVHPLVFAALTALTATVALGVFTSGMVIRFFRERGFHAVVSLLPIGFWSTGVASLAFFYGVRTTSGGNAAILLQVEPVYALILGWFFLGERPGVRQLAGTAFVLAGALVIVWEGGFSPSTGDLLLLATPLFWQIGNMRARQCLLSGVPTGVVTFSRLAVGSIVLLAAAALSGSLSQKIPTDGVFWGSVVAVGVFCMALCYTLWFQGLRRVPIGKATAFFSACPVVAILLSWFLLGEIPVARQFVGLAIVMAGLWVLAPSEKK